MRSPCRIRSDPGDELLPGPANEGREARDDAGGGPAAVSSERLDLGTSVARCVAVSSGWGWVRAPRLRWQIDPTLVARRVGVASAFEALLLQLLHPTLSWPSALAPELRLRAGEHDAAMLRLELDDLAEGGPRWPSLPPAGPADLGPALAAALAERMGGWIAADRLARGGQRLCCELQLPPAPEAMRRRGGSAREVLLVEDNPDGAEMLVEMLHQAGDVQVHIAASGTQALAAVLERRVDLVLLDMFLPDTDGVVVARRMRRVLGDDAPPIVALTASGEPADRALCLDAGMVDYLVKPVTVVQLHTVLQRWALQPRAAGPLPPGHGGTGLADPPVGLV